jgi:hypothetical protein
MFRISKWIPDINWMYQVILNMDEQNTNIEYRRK